MSKLGYDEWYGENEDRIDMELAESGADRELDFDPEQEYEDRWLKYLDEK